MFITEHGRDDRKGCAGGTSPVLADRMRGSSRHSAVVASLSDSQHTSNGLVPDKSTSVFGMIKYC